MILCQKSFLLHHLREAERLGKLAAPILHVPYSSRWVQRCSSHRKKFCRLFCSAITAYPGRAFSAPASYAALYTGDIGHNDAGAECLLVFTHPVEQDVRIQRENDEVGSAYRLGIGLGVADVDVVMSEREIYRIVAAVDQPQHDSPLRCSAIA